MTAYQVEHGRLIQLRSQRAFDGRFGHAGYYATLAEAMERVRERGALDGGSVLCPCGQRVHRLDAAPERCPVCKRVISRIVVTPPRQPEPKPWRRAK